MFVEAFPQNRETAVEICFLLSQHERANHLGCDLQLDNYSVQIFKKDNMLAVSYVVT